MTKLNTISWQLTAPVHEGKYAESGIVPHKSQSWKRIVLMPATLLAFSLTVPLAHSQAVTSVPGTACHPVFASRNFVEYDQFGVYNNTATNTATVECPIIVHAPAIITMREVLVFVYDRNTSANVSCILRGADVVGNLVFVQTSSSFGAMAAAQGIAFRFNSPSGAFLWTLRCTIPRIQSGGRSHITSILAYNYE